MAEASIDIVAGYDGFVRHGAATVTGVSYDALVPQEDTVFTSFTVTQENGTATNVLSARGMSGITFKQGVICPLEKVTKSLALSLRRAA